MIPRSGSSALLGMPACSMPGARWRLGGVRGVLNLAHGEEGDSTFALVEGWLCGCFHPDGSFPLLALLGEQGTGKTTTAKVLKRLIDPSEDEIGVSRASVRDLTSTARRGWISTWTTSPDGSPTRCAAWPPAAGSRHGNCTPTRRVDLSRRNARSILNGIEDFVTRATCWIGVS